MIVWCACNALSALSKEAWTVEFNAFFEIVPEAIDAVTSVNLPSTSLTVTAGLSAADAWDTVESNPAIALVAAPLASYTDPNPAIAEFAEFAALCAVIASSWTLLIALIAAL